jgi:hypothetical protein
VPDDDRALDTHGFHQAVDLVGDVSRYVGSPPLAPCAGMSIAMLVTEPSSSSMIGRQVRRSKVSPCTKTTGVPVPSMS